MLQGMPNEKLPNHVVMQVRRILKDEFLQVSTVASAARVTFKWYHPGDSFDTGIVQWVRIMRMIHNFAPKGDSWEDQRIAKTCEALQLSLTNLYAANLQASEFNFQKLVRIKEGFAEKTSTLYSPPFLQSMARQLLYQYGLRVRTLKIFAEYFTDERLSMISQWGEVGDGEVEEAAANLQELRVYGLKPCIFNDGLLHPDGYAWVFNDAFELIRNLDPDQNHGLMQPLAFTHLADLKTITRIRPKTYKDRYQFLSLGFEPHLAVAIQNGGIMTMDAEQGIIPIEDIFREASLGSVYPRFQLVHLMRLFDLVVPEIVTRDIPEWPTLPSTRRGREKFQTEAPEMWRSLSLPRKRILRDPASLKAALRQEITEGLELTQQQLKESSAEPREIIGFLRRLAKGHKASPEAIQRAWTEQRLPVPPGYTYQKTTGEGTVEEIIHRVQNKRRRS